MKQFFNSGIPAFHFGAGQFGKLSGILSSFGKSVLIFADGRSIYGSEKYETLIAGLREKGLTVYSLPVQGEPSPELVDNAVKEFSDKGINSVCSIGGGSVIDAGKAVSAMYGHTDSVEGYLEGAKEPKTHDGVKLPFVAVPTTAGTGSEATKNAVLSRVGANGFKKSIRHDNMVPDIAVIDPELMVSCPPQVTAASGMDAFTQLLEAYVSTKATPFTDALAMSGLSAAFDKIVPLSTTEGGNVDKRGSMAYASFLSGIVLANAGLGIVHGFASAVGGFFPIPHGVVCGTMMAPSIKITVERLIESGASGLWALGKYADAGRLFVPDCSDNKEACFALVENIENWTDTLHIPRLSEFGVKREDFGKIIEETGNKNNPVALDKGDMERILSARL